jgi:hypothetical protein
MPVAAMWTGQGGFEDGSAVHEQALIQCLPDSVIQTGGVLQILTFLKHIAGLSCASIYPADAIERVCSTFFVSVSDSVC